MAYSLISKVENTAFANTLTEDVDAVAVLRTGILVVYLAKVPNPLSNYLTGGYTMKLAITYENGNVFQHFGQTKQFKIYTIEDNAIVSSEIRDTKGNEHCGLGEVLQTWGVSTLICGGLGEGAKIAVANAGLDLFAGVTGSVDEAADAFVNGELEHNPNVVCIGHGDGEHHHHHDDGCGHHHH